MSELKNSVSLGIKLEFSFNIERGPVMSTQAAKLATSKSDKPASFEPAPVELEAYGQNDELYQLRKVNVVMLNALKIYWAYGQSVN